MPDLRSIAERLIGRPLYVVLASDGVPESIITPRKYAGCQHRRLDLAFRDWLTSRGEWQGRRPCVFVDDTITLDPRAILVHELAHVIDARESATGESLDRPVSTVLMRSLVMPSSTCLAGDDPVSRAQHGPNFVRVLCHLWYRAVQMECRCDLSDTYCGEYYGLPDIGDSDSALLNEPEALAYLSIFKIADTTPPLPFRQLWMPYS